MEPIEKFCDQELYEKSWDWFGEIILANDIDRFTSSLDDISISESADVFFKKHDAIYRSLIDQILKKAQLKNIFTKKIPQVIRVLAILTGIFTITISIAAASSLTVRTYLAQLIIQMTPEYTVLRIEKETDSIQNIPPEWTGQYYPGIIPENLVINQVFSDSQDYKEVTFCNPDSRRIMFSFTEIANGSVNLDTEKAESQSVEINHYSGTLICKSNSVEIHWFDGETLFIVYIRDKTVDEAIKYAEGIKKISSKSKE